MSRAPKGVGPTISPKSGPSMSRASGNADGAGSVQGQLFLPRTLFVTIGLQALPALVLVHLQTAFLFQVAHVVRRKTVWCGDNSVKPK